MGEIRVVLQSLKMSVHTRMQYRAESLANALAVFIRESANIIAIYLALLKFDKINGWNVNEMLFLYSILFLTYAFVVSLFADLRQFSDTIREGFHNTVLYCRDYQWYTDTGWNLHYDFVIVLLFRRDQQHPVDFLLEYA